MHTSRNPRNANAKDVKATLAATAHGRKYGCTWRSSIFPRVSGHFEAALARVPPMKGLDGVGCTNQQRPTDQSQAHLVVEPRLHINWRVEKTSATFEGSEIWYAVSSG